MRIFFIGFLAVAFSIFGDATHAQSLPGSNPNAPKVKYQTPKEISKPIREDRLKELLPVIRGIYANQNRYTQRQNGYGEDRTYSYFETVKTAPEVAITLQNLDDIATVIDFLKRREARSVHYPNGPSLPPPSHSGFHDLWPDDVNFVLGPGLKGCDAFCRQLLLDTEFASITVLETEVFEEEGNLQPVRAMRYSLDARACETPRDGHRLMEGNDEALNLPSSQTPSAKPALGLCFESEPVEVPENGAFIYFNHASPFWPDEFERTHSRIEHVPDPLRAIQRVVNPKAFEDLETEFNVSFIKHIAYEFRAQGMETKTVFAYESACIRPPPLRLMKGR